MGVFLILRYLAPRQRFRGQLLATYFILAGLARFVVEFWRGDDRGPALLWQMPTTQVMALGITGIGFGLWFWRCRASKVLP